MKRPLGPYRTPAALAVEPPPQRAVYSTHARAIVGIAATSSATMATWLFTLRPSVALAIGCLAAWALAVALSRPFEARR